MQTKRLYRSRSTRMLGGVAGGLAEYFDVDPIIMRLVFIGLVFFGGGGVVIYIIMWIVVPENPDLSYFYSKPDSFNSNPSGYSSPGGFDSNPSGFSSNPGNYDSKPSGYDSNPGDTYTSSPDDEPNPLWEEEQPLKPSNRNSGGLIAGLILITLGVLFLLERFIPRINFGDLWPVLLIIAGIVLLTNAYIKPKNEQQ